MSEKSDLWVPLLLALSGLLLLGWNVSAGRGLVGGLALVVGAGGALLCLPIRLRRGQGETVVFAAGVLALLLATVPGAVATVLDALAWLLVASAFLVRLPPLPVGTRAVLLAASAGALVVALLCRFGPLPVAATGLSLALAFALALEVFHARPRRAPPEPVGPRVAILGGSFDPFHRGHRVLAEAALKVADRLLVVPAGQPPHKLGREEATPFHHRLQMARLGVEGLGRVEVLSLEGRRPGPSYTVDTLDVVRRTQPESARLLLVLGADMFQDFPTWHDCDRILEMVTLLVADRPGFDLDPPPELEGRSVVIERLPAPAVDVSSSRVRAAIQNGESVGDLVSPSVLAYVRAHGLYGAR